MTNESLTWDERDRQRFDRPQNKRTQKGKHLTVAGVQNAVNARTECQMIPLVPEKTVEPAK